ncbi:MAG TPA: ABC transporter permease [Thermoanaerobaculia bacterium]|nr:ABC transporter permease [Thermoanaerobaculia bacterium]
MLWSTLSMSLQEIRRNTLRSLLTMLGVIIGVGAVVVLVTLGEGASAKVEADIAKLGDNLLIVSPGASRRGPASGAARPFERADAAAIEREIAGLAGVAPAAQSRGLVVAGNRNWNASLVGTTPAYLDVRGYEVALGRAFTPAEAAAGRPVVLLGETVRQELFGGRDPVGEQVRVGRVPAEVVGVLASKGEAAFGGDQDDLVLMPLAAFQRRVAGSTDVGQIYVSAAEGRPTILVKSQIEALLAERRPPTPSGEPDFSVRDMAEIAATMASATGALAALLGAIAAVSLVVGGIGIMNIMLVSVTERTREIGIRLSIGALPREVLLQFLVEAVTLSSFGGALGILFGLGGGWAAARALAVPFLVVPEIVVVAFLFSALVGIAFGILPARRAARLNPIDALRRE